jgi:DNA-binding transcriptional MerR regulator
MPSFRDEKTGYRFYSDNDIGKMNNIITLKTSGFELSQIMNYFDDTYVPGTLLEALNKKRELLDRQIEIFSDFRTESGVYIVKEVTIPDCPCLYMERFITSRRCMSECFHNLISFAVKYKTRIIPLSSYNTEFPTCDFKVPGRARVCLGIEEEDITDSIPKDLLWVLPGGNYLSVIHKGPYHGLKNAYDALNEFSEIHQIKTGTCIRNIYMKNPSIIDNPKEFITKLLVPTL